MADTTHATLAALLATLPVDGPFVAVPTGPGPAVSAQDIRDLAATLDALITARSGSYGQLTINADTGGQVIGTPYETITEWDVATPASSDITTVVAGTHTVTNAGVYKLTFKGTYVTASTAVVTFSAAVDGTEEGPEVSVINVSTEDQGVSLHHFVTLAAGEALSVSMKGAAAETVTFKDCTFLIERK